MAHSFEVKTAAPLPSDQAQSAQVLSPEALSPQALWAHAIDFVANGLSVVPLRLDGSKAPAIRSWATLQKKMPTAAELRCWFQQPVGIGIVCGAVSGNLEVLDFDDGGLFAPWLAEVESQAPSLKAELAIVHTPSDGYHVFYRCDSIAGNCKLAVDPQREKKTLIETRGQGGYVVGVGSPGSVHPSGRCYVQIAGPKLPCVRRISTADRELLWRCAQQFDRSGLTPKSGLGQDATVSSANQAKPRAIGSWAAKLKPTTTWHRRYPEHPAWVAFKANVPWPELLRMAQWRSTDGVHWTRPQKTRGVSATLRRASNGDEVLVVFSTNADVSTRTHNKVSFYTETFFQGCYREALNHLRKEGFGCR